MHDVVRVGDTVVRPAGPWTPAVHRLLAHLAEAGVDGVPRPLGTTDDGREVVSWVEGVVPSYPMPTWVWGDEALDSAARLLRVVHDATVGFDPSGPWRSPVREPAEVVCHHDFATYNLVFVDGRAVGAIDWDYAAPGPRLWDLCYLAYRIVPLSDADRADGLTDAERRARLQRLLTSYGATATPAELLVMLRDRLLDLADHSERTAHERGRPELVDHARLYRHDASSLANA